MNSDSFKNALRQRYKTRRQQLSSAEQEAASAKVCEQIRSLECYQSAKRIAIYHAIAGEIDLSGLREKTCYFPVMNTNQTLSFLPVTQDTVFYKNRFGIAEPEVKHELAIRPDRLDIVFLPLVAFDDHGTRLGMGGGYYDRTLAQHRPALLIGVGHEFQHEPFIERQPWDVPMAAVMTECNMYWSK